MTDVVSLANLEAEPHAHLFDGAEPKTVRLSLAAGESVPAHDHPGRTIVCHVLEGAMELRLGEQTHSVTAGDIARFSGDQAISPTATEPTTALLVLAATD